MALLVGFKSIDSPVLDGCCRFFGYTLILLAVFKAAWRRPTFVHLSDYTVCPAGWLITCLTNSKVIYHEHDSPQEGGGIKNRLLMRFRRWLAQRAALCILPNIDRAQAFEVQCRCTKPAMVVWNCPSLAEISQIKTSFASCPGKNLLRVGYAGTINEVRVPSQLIEALALSPGTSLTLVGYETVGSRGHVKRLEQLADKLGVADRFRYAGALPERADVFRELAANDVCLGLMPMEGGDINTRAMVGASNKAFDAFACGLPIVVSELPDWKSAYVDAGVALACDPRNSNSIAEVFRWYKDHVTERLEMGKKARHLVEESWNYENQFAPVMTSLGLSKLLK